MLRTGCLCTPMYVEALILQCDGIWRQGLWEVIRGNKVTRVGPSC